MELLNPVSTFSKVLLLTGYTQSEINIDNPIDRDKHYQLVSSNYLSVETTSKFFPSTYCM